MKIVDPERLLRMLDFTFGKRHGSQLKVSCPYAANKHGSGVDNDPSCSIDLEKQVFKCFACGSAGTLLQACAQKAIGLDDEAAVYGLYRKYREMIESFSAKVADPALVEKWHQDLMDNPEAMAVLAEKKGITEATMREYLLGWRQGRYTIPMKNEHGDIVLVKGYSTDPGISSNDKMKKVGGYTADLIFPVEALKEDSVVITEGEVKALLLRQYGINACAGTTGAKGWEDSWSPLFRGKTVWILYDNDQAGRTGAIDVARCLYRTALKINIVTLPPFDNPSHNDITDYLVTLGKTNEDLTRLFESAVEWTPGDPTQDSPTPTLPLTPVERLSQVKDHAFVGKHVSVRALVGAEDDEPYAVPAKWKVGCLEDQGKTCSRCPVHIFQRTEFAIPPHRVEALRFVDIPEFILNKELDRFAGIPKDCSDHTNSVVEHHNLRMVELLPDVEHNASDAETLDTVPAYIVGAKTSDEANALHSLKGFPTPFPANQRLVLYAYEAESHADSLDALSLDEERIESIRQSFCPSEWTADAIWERLSSLYDEYARSITGIIGRPDVHLGIDLVYHSVIAFDLKGKRTNGWVDGIILGDTATGKTEVSAAMRSFYGFGDKAVSSTSSFAGLIGSTQESVKRRRWVTRWGKIPLNDRRQLTVEECGLLNESIYAFMRDIRSSGKIIIDKAKRNAALARTRILWIGNARDNRPIDQFSHGILALRSIVPGDPDIRRFDFCIITGLTDVSRVDIEKHLLERKGDESPVSRADAHDLVHWAWSRRAEHVSFIDGADDLCVRAATALSRKYSERLPLVGPSMHDKIARLAVAMAARTFSTSDGHDLLVMPCHVEAVVAFLNRIYSHPASDYAGWSRLEFDKDALEDLDGIKSMILGKFAPNGAGLITHSRTVVEFLLDNDVFTTSSFGMASSLNRTDTERYLGYLLRSKAIKAYPRTMDGYVKTPGFARFLREMLRDRDLKDRSGEDVTKGERF